MSAWPTVKLGEVLRRSNQSIDPEAAMEYREITVKLWGNGVVERGRALGSSMSGRRFVARTGQFIASRIDARNGAMGLVPETLDGALVTNDFPLFDLSAERILPEFLGWLSKTAGFVELCLKASEGTTNRVRLKEERFLALEIPLPPLAEQRRVVARIEELAAQIHEARTFRQQAAEAAVALTAAHLGAEFANLSKHYPTPTLETLTTHILDGPHVTPSYLPAGVSGVPFVTVKNMVTGKLDFSELNYVSEEDHRTFSRRCKAERGDVLYSKDGATRGRPCFVDTDREFSYFVSVALIKPDREKLDGRYLAHLLNSNWIKDRMADKSRGDMIPHIVLREIRAFPVPMPPLPDQRRIVAELDASQAEVDALKRLQAETAAELDALLPAVLDRAFKGELLPPDRVNVTPREPGRRTTRVIPKAQSYLLRFIPALLRAAGQPVSLDALNATVALLFMPREDLLPVLARLAGPPARAHFEDFEIAYQEGAFLSAVQMLLRTGTLAPGDDPSFGSTLGLGGNLPPITLEIEADARHLAPLIGSVPPEVVAPILSRLQPARVKETVLMPT